MIRLLVQYVYRPWVLWYLRSDRYYTYRGSRVLVKKGVFHPGLFFSTRFLLSELEQENIQGKKVLELGAGSGLISLIAAKRGAQVTATDINPEAIAGLHVQLDGHDAQVIASDLFDAVPQQTFDLILINPPYYPKQPQNDAEKAWYCGEQFEYFDKLFLQIGRYMHPSTIVWVSFSEDCEIGTIGRMAQEHALALRMRRERKFIWEMNYIYSLEPIEGNRINPRG